MCVFNDLDEMKIQSRCFCCLLWSWTNENVPRVSRLKDACRDGDGNHGLVITRDVLDVSLLIVVMIVTRGVKWGGLLVLEGF